MAPNVSGVGAPGRRTVYGMCGMCAVRCPMEVTVEDGRVTWLQGNPNDRALGTSLCAKGAAGLSLEFDDERPQSPLIRSGPRGSGQWRRASWDEALDYVADKLKETIEVFGGRGIALSDRGGPFNDLTRTFVQALGSPNYFNHDAGCGGNVHNAARSIYGFGHEGLIPDLPRVKHLVLYGRNIVESLTRRHGRHRGLRLHHGPPHPEPALAGALPRLRRLLRVHHVRHRRRSLLPAPLLRQARLRDRAAQGDRQPRSAWPGSTASVSQRRC